MIPVFAVMPVMPVFAVMPVFTVFTVLTQMYAIQRLRVAEAASEHKVIQDGWGTLLRHPAKNIIWPKLKHAPHCKLTIKLFSDSSVNITIFSSLNPNLVRGDIN